MTTQYTLTVKAKSKEGRDPMKLVGDLKMLAWCNNPSNVDGQFRHEIEGQRSRLYITCTCKATLDKIAAVIQDKYNGKIRTEVTQA